MSEVIFFWLALIATLVIFAVDIIQKRRSDLR